MIDHPYLSVSTRCLSSSLKPAIALASQLQVTGVQLDTVADLRPDEFSETARRQLLNYLREHNLIIASMTLPMRRGLLDPKQMDQKVSEIKDSMIFAAKLNCSKFVFRTGQLPEVDSTEDQILYEIINDIAKHGNHFGVTPCLSCSAESPERFKSLITPIKTGPVHINLDLGTMVLNNQSISDWMREHHDVIGHITLRDAIRDVRGESGETVIGEGGVDWNEFFAMLQEIAYRGPLNIVRNEGNRQKEDMELNVRRVSPYVMGSN